MEVGESEVEIEGVVAVVKDEGVVAVFCEYKIETNESLSISFPKNHG